MRLNYQGSFHPLKMTRGDMKSRIQCGIWNRTEDNFDMGRKGSSAAAEMDESWIIKQAILP